MTKCSSTLKSWVLILHRCKNASLNTLTSNSSLKVEYPKIWSRFQMECFRWTRDPIVLSRIWMCSWRPTKILSHSCALLTTRLNKSLNSSNWLNLKQIAEMCLEKDQICHRVVTKCLSKRIKITTFPFDLEVWLEFLQELEIRMVKLGLKSSKLRLRC